MRIIFLLLLFSSQYLLTSAFQLRSSDWVSKNRDYSFKIDVESSPENVACSRTAISLAQADSKSEWDNLVWLQPVAENPKRSLLFSLFMATCGAGLGPFLDS